MKRRLFSLFLALTLVVGMLPAPAFAQETEPTQVTEASTEAPATEAPATEVPATEAPATEAPAAEPTPAPTEALAPETTVAPAPTEAPTEPAPTEDEAVAAVQAMIDALPDVDDMSESYLDALVAAYSAFEALSETQQAQITGVEKLEALFNWVNSQVSTLAAEETISGEVTWNNQTFTTPVKLTGETTLTLVGDNKIECDAPLNLNNCKLTVKGTGSLELVGSNNDGNYYNSGTIYDSTWTGTSYTGGGMVIESGTVIARADVYNAVAVRYLYMDGGKLEAYGARAGIVTTDLQIKDGSLYATGNSKCGINMYSAPRAVSVNGLNILVSNEPNAQDADMEDGTTSQIQDSEKKTVAIGKFSTSPSISVQAQQGYLYEATAKTATFALSGRNVDLSALNFAWDGTHTGLEAAASADGKTLTVTTDKTVQAGTYRLKVSAGEASKTAVVTVSGPPICIYERPVDTISTDPEAGEVHVSAYLTKGHSGSIAFQWKQEDGTVMEGYTGENVSLYDLVELGMLTQDASKPWLKTIRIYCTLSYDGYSLNTDTVTVGLNSCTHTKVDHEGCCAQCGQKKGDGDALLVREDGLYFLIANAEQDEADAGHFMYSGGNFYLTGDVPNKTVNVSYNDVGGKNVTLDLQGHTMKSLQMGNFPYGTFTVKNGTLGVIDTVAGGKLILENIRYKDPFISAQFDLTVQGENTHFELPVAFLGTTHLRGGHFDKGLNPDCAARALELLEDGFAFYDSADKVVDATDSARLVGREIRVASHICSYRYGKCACGRSCDHQGTTDENGYCTKCGTFVYPFAIGEKLYTGLEAALTAAQAGDTVTLRGDYDMQAATVEITKSITLELNGHTLSGWPYAPILTILAPDVTIQNGTVKNTDTSKSSPAVQVGSLSITGATLTVKDAIFEGSESHGNPRNYGLSIFAGNTTQVENGTFTGGISVSGSLTLSGGKADHIYVGTGVTYASLLADGYAYQAKGQLVKRENMADGIAVEVVKCGHPDGLTDTEACAYCGLTCPHSTVSDETGLCQKCGSQVYEANVTTADGTVTGYRTLEDALRNGADATVKLLADCKGEDTFHVTVPLTLDLNGKRMEGPTGLLVKKGPTTILDSSPAKTGTIAGTSNWKYSGGGLWVYKDANVTLTILGGHFEGKTDGLRLVGQNTLILEGGSFSSMHFIEGATATLRDSLAPGYAYYKDADNTLYDPGNDQKATVRLRVGAHPEHTLDSSGHCPCGYTAAATLATEAGKQYFADFGDALEAAKAASGSTLTLFRDVALTNNIYIDRGTFTVDWHGHTISGEMSNDLLVITGAAKVTLTDSVGTGTTGGLRNVGGAAIGVYYGGSLTVRGGVYSPQLCKYESAYGSIQISGGRFENPEDSGRNGALYCDTGALAGLLAPGYAFAYEDDEALFDVYHQKKSEDYRSVYVVEHQEHEFDDEGQCSCGYLCPHDEVDEEGDCKLCGKRFYVRGTYANGTTHYYGTISDALGDSAVTQAKILHPLTEECESWNGGDRSVTLDLNGWNLVVERIQGGHLILRDSSGIGSILAVKEIQKDGQVSVESGRLAPQGETLSVSGKLTVTGGKVDSLTAMEGSTVSLSGGYVESLTAMEGSTVSLSGGTFGEIVGSGVTLRSLLAENRYYAELGGETPKDYADTDTVLEGVSVVRCDHTSVREDKQGYFPVYTCNCGKVRYLLTVTDGSGSVTYHSDYSEGFAYAAECSGVVRLLEKWPNDQTITMDVNGTVAIDMSGKSMIGTANLIIADGTTLKIVSDGVSDWDSNFPAGSITVRSGGTLILPAKGPSGGDNKLEISGAVIVEAGAQAELSGGKCPVYLWGAARISGGKYNIIDVRGTENKLTVTGGEIGQLYLWGEIQNVKLSGGRVSRLLVSEANPDTLKNYRTVTFENIQSLLAPGKAFRKADNTWLTEGDVQEETLGTGEGTVKVLPDVTIADVPMTGAAVYCQLGADTYEDTVSTQYNVGETDSSGNVVFRLGVNIQSQEVQPGVTVEWYELGAEDSRTPAGTGLICPLDLRLPVGTHRFLAVVNCSGYVLESQPFAVTITPRVVNITGGFTAQDRDYVPEDRSVRIIQGEVTFDKKAEEDDLSAQVHGGTIATPDAGQDRTVDYSVTLTGEDKDNYTLGSKPELTVNIRPASQTLTFAESTVTKTYGDSPFVNALDHSTGDGRITYTSSDPAVATVGTDGTVTILKSGTVKITAKAGATQNYGETSASFDLTVAKAAGTLVNKNYPTEFTYGDTIPTPKAENFTSNHPDGAFSYYWITGDGYRLEVGANPTRAGTYMLYATWAGGTNYTTASLSLAVTIQKAAQTANIAVVNETISGKGDGGVKLLPSAEGYEIRKKGETTFEAIVASQDQTFMTLAPGVTYEIRLAETKNYLPSAIQEITVQPGRKLEVILPTNQKGYTLTASKTQLDWHEDVELSFQLDSVGAYKAADFGIWAEAGSEKTKLTLGNDGAVKLTAPEKDITITVTGVKTDDVAPKVFIQGRLCKDSFDYFNWEGFQENPADDYVNGKFVISATDRVPGVASLWYCLSKTPLTRADMDTASWKQAGQVSITEDGVYYLYAKALDKANNAGYACTGKLVKESNPPTFSGVENGKTYYVSQQMEIHDDGMPDWYKAEGSIGVVPNGGNENPIKLRLENNGSPYTITAGDRCGNEASITVYMKPLSDLTQPLDSILEETIQKSDRATLDEVEATLKGLDVTHAFDSEKKEINDALARIAELRQVLDQVAAVEAQIDALPDSVEPYQQTVEDTQIKPARQAYSDLTDHQKTLVDSTKLDKLVRLEAQLNAWTITEGDGQIWYKGSWNPLSFTVNGQSRKFSKVLLDGKMSFTATPSFLAVSGSTDEPFTLTLKPELLQVSMKPGEHTLTVIYGENNSGTGTVTFTVEIPANYLDVTGKPEFDGKTTVTVDGKEYPIEEMGGERYVNLPETGDLLTIYSFKDGTPTGSYTNYPTGMQVFRITRQEGGAKAEEITEFANLLNYAGCSIRISGKQGIRMITGITQDNKKALTSKAGLSGYTLEEYGTVVMRGVGTPTLENSKSHNYAYKKGVADPIFSRANGMIQYTNVLVGFSLEDCAKDLILRPYIKLKDMTTGETVTLYGGCVSRSIGYVAKQNENTYKPGSSGYKYVHKIIDAVYGKTEQGGKTK